MTICSKLPSLQAHLAAQRKHWQGCRAWLVRIWSKMRGTRWGARKPNDEANFHTFCIIWDVIFLFRKYIRIYRNLTNRNMIPKFGKWYSYMFLFFDGKRPNGIGQRICNLRWCHHTWSLRRLATKLCFQYIQTRSSFLFCFTHIYNVWNILMAYIWFMQWLVQILYPYIYIMHLFGTQWVGAGVNLFASLALRRPRSFPRQVRPSEFAWHVSSQPSLRMHYASWIGAGGWISWATTDFSPF